MKTVELKLQTPHLTKLQKSRGYAALTNHVKQRLLSIFDEKSIAKDRLENEANDGKQK